MDSNCCNKTVSGLSDDKSESLFERVSWFYALCREYLFRDHTEKISEIFFQRTAPHLGVRLLEVGCGPGFYACNLSKTFRGLETIGIDLSRSLLRRAKLRSAALQLSNCSFRHADAHSLPFPSSSIDFIVVSRLFLVVSNKEGVISEIFRVLKPQGRVFIAEPTSRFRTRIPLAVMWLLSRLGKMPAGKYREPQQADVMAHADFAALISTQAWGATELQSDGWYQYAICDRGLACKEEQHQDAFASSLSIRHPNSFIPPGAEATHAASS